MRNKRPGKRAGQLAVVLLLIVLCGYLWFSGESHSTVTGSYNPTNALRYMDDMRLETGNPDSATMEAGGRTYYRMAESGTVTLWMEPSAGYIALKDSRQQDGIWLSNPSLEALQTEQTKGLWRSNLDSPFTFRYLKGSDNKETVGNIVDHPAKVEWRRIEGGVGIRYTLNDLGFTFYFEYAVTGDGFQVRVPDLGIVEKEDNRLVELDVLPFFAAAQSGRDGYLFVPDGPGGLISFQAKRASLSAPYDYPVFDADLSVPQIAEWFPRTPIQYPVFGMNRGDSGFLAVIEEGQYKANIYAAPAGLHTSFHSVNGNFRLRRAYRQPTGLTKSVTGYEKPLMAEPLKIRYVLLTKSETDYVGMAKSYRRYLTENLKLSKLKTADNSPPLYLDVLMATSEPGRFRDKTVVATTFEQTEEIAETLTGADIRGLHLGISGWQDGGYPGWLPKRFPVEKRIGGLAGIRQLSEYSQKNGMSVYLIDSLNVATDRTGNRFSPRSEAARMLDGRALKFERKGDWFGNAELFYAMSPRVMERVFDQSVERYKETSVNGLGIAGMDKLYSDYNRNRFYDRNASAAVYQSTMRKARETIGEIISYGAPSYTIGYAEHYHQFPVENNYDFIVDEQVPFYPIALHGLVTYSAAAGNERGNPDVEFLRAIEYGALPYFFITAGDSRILKRTNFSNLYSSQFEVLKDKIIGEYRAFETALSGVWRSYIGNHRKVADGVYETSYENGRIVWVNYNDAAFEGEGHRVEGMSFQVIKEGEHS
ncbi:DUF5696 domain-containing protein [Paenibacillus sp. MBLB4367]|uniref:DUF5696 domain-containing protein n=1 Tax=Paenibacillus sp. MBLB4367 TaxID=3384767 RepID=UPI00390810A5